MSTRIVTFSIRPKDTVAQKLIEDLQIKSIQTGISFSHMCIQGLKMYQQSITNVTTSINKSETYTDD